MLAAVVALALFARRPGIPPANFERVETGMTVADVEAIFGIPGSVAHPAQSDIRQAARLDRRGRDVARGRFQGRASRRKECGAARIGMKNLPAYPSASPFQGGATKVISDRWRDATKMSRDNCAATAPIALQRAITMQSRSAARSCIALRSLMAQFQSLKPRFLTGRREPTPTRPPPRTAAGTGRAPPGPAQRLRPRRRLSNPVWRLGSRYR